MKELKITVPEGFKFKDAKIVDNVLTYKVEEVKDDWCESFEELGTLDGFFITRSSEIKKTGLDCKASGTNKNIIPTKEEAEGILALIQLLQLRDRANGDWKPDFTDVNMKYNILTYRGELTVECCYNFNRIMVFETKKVRDRFLDSHRDLLETAKMFL